jgi:peptidoglycan/xylan/chitin deacetylase (PgdA/CDA1 family)
VNWIGKPGFLSVSQLRELHASGFEIGCHSMTHAYLSDLDDAGLQREIADAKFQLEQMLGSAIEHFSCPGGRIHPRAADVAKGAGLQSISTSLPRCNTPMTDRYSLGRIALQRALNLQAFQSISQGRGLRTAEFSGALRDGAKRILGNTIYDRVRALVLGK